MDQNGSKSHEASQNIREHFAKDGAFFRKEKKYRTVRNYSEHTGNEARNRWNVAKNEGSNRNGGCMRFYSCFNIFQNIPNMFWHIPKHPVDKLLGCLGFANVILGWRNWVGSLPTKQPHASENGRARGLGYMGLSEFGSWWVMSRLGIKLRFNNYFTFPHLRVFMGQTVLTRAPYAPWKTCCARLRVPSLWPSNVNCNPHCRPVHSLTDEDSLGRVRRLVRIVATYPLLIKHGNWTSTNINLYHYR